MIQLQQQERRRIAVVRRWIVLLLTTSCCMMMISSAFRRGGGSSVVGVAAAASTFSSATTATASKSLGGWFRPRSRQHSASWKGYSHAKTAFLMAPTQQLQRRCTTTRNNLHLGLPPTPTQENLALDRLFFPTRTSYSGRSSKNRGFDSRCYMSSSSSSSTGTTNSTTHDDDDDYCQLAVQHPEAFPLDGTLCEHYDTTKKASSRNQTSINGDDSMMDVNGNHNDTSMKTKRNSMAANQDSASSSSSTQSTSTTTEAKPNGVSSSSSQSPNGSDSKDSSGDNDASTVKVSVSSAVLAIDPAIIDIVRLDRDRLVIPNEKSIFEDDDDEEDNDYYPPSSSPQVKNRDDKSIINAAGAGTSATSAAMTNDRRMSSALLPFVAMFRGAANYIANHRNTVAVYHIPGELLDRPMLDHPNLFRDLMNDVALTWLLGMKVVLVVGCQYQVDQRKRQNNSNGASQKQKLHPLARAAGLSVTDRETLRIVKEEAGYVRFEVERQLARSLRMQGSSHVGGGGNAAAVNGASAFGGPQQFPRSASASPAGYPSSPDSYMSSIGQQGKVGGAGAAGGNGAAKFGGAPFDGNVVSGNFYSAQPIGILGGIDYQYTGFVRRVEVEKIHNALNSRDICLLTTLGVSPSGEVFNVNSENLAAVVAGSLRASKLIYFTEKEMEVRHKVHENKIQSLRVSDAHNLLDFHNVKMHQKGYASLTSDEPPELDRYQMSYLLKIGWSMLALEQGVKRAHIISPTHGALLQELYTRDGSGTLVSGDLYDGIRRATVHDVDAIHQLISPLIAMGTLIDRPKAVLEKDIETYYVYTRDDLIVACGQLKRFEDGFAEIGCLVVNKEYRSQGRGDAMLGYLERICLLNGCNKIFVLSTQTMEWFVEREFDEVGVPELPPSRQATYNYDRGSKIYLKQIESDRDLDASELWWNR